VIHLRIVKVLGVLLILFNIVINCKLECDLISNKNYIKYFCLAVLFIFSKLLYAVLTALIKTIKIFQYLT